jgi:hypothetical protein
MRHCDGAAAIALYNRAAATGALSLDNASGMVARLFTVVADDPSLRPGELRDLAKSVGWDRLDARHSDDPIIRQRIQGRLAAEEWYDALLASAERGGGAVDRYTARLLLKRTGRFFMDVRSSTVKPVIETFRRHEPFLANRIDPQWVARLERRIRRRTIFALTAWVLLCLQVLTGLVAEFVQLFVEYVDSTPFSVWPIGAMGIMLLAFITIGVPLARLWRLVVPEKIRQAIRTRLDRLRAHQPK